MKTSDHFAAAELARLCAVKGVRHAVISPGSRSAPLVIAFAQQEGIQCLQVIDERSAAFFALGHGAATARTGRVDLHQWKRRVELRPRDRRGFLSARAVCWSSLRIARRNGWTKVKAKRSVSKVCSHST